MFNHILSEVNKVKWFLSCMNHTISMVLIFIASIMFTSLLKKCFSDSCSQWHIPFPLLCICRIVLCIICFVFLMIASLSSLLTIGSDAVKFLIYGGDFVMQMSVWIFLEKKYHLELFKTFQNVFQKSKGLHFLLRMLFKRPPINEYISWLCYMEQMYQWLT